MHRLRAFGLLALAWSALALAASDVEERRRMLEEISATAAYTGAETGRPRFSPEVIRALGKIPRHEFVPPASRTLAYANQPVAIGYGQTISQPYIVALMTDLLDLERADRVLEIGTGSAYQAAVLAELVDRVYTIEIIEPLARQAGQRLQRLGYGSVEVRHADGYHGWPEHAPFDAIVVTAAASHVPPPLIEQLGAGGVMVIPVGGRFAVQQLLLIRKLEDGGIQTRQVLPVRFVPLTGAH